MRADNARTGSTRSDPAQDQSVGLLQDRRLVARVLRHWTEMAMAQRLPRRADIDPWMIGEDWANCALLQVNWPLQQSIFVAVGENILPARDPSLAGALIAACPSDTLLSVVLSHLSQVSSARACLTIEGTALHLGAMILYRAVLMPVSDNSVTLDHILAAVNYRELRAGEPRDLTTRLTWTHGLKRANGWSSEDLTLRD